jgi:thiol-disulfide isomerase/thioredoxin
MKQTGKLADMKTILSLILLLLAGTTPLAFATTPGEVEVGAVLREAPMQGLSGPSRLLSDFRGKPLIINVWASWCGPCQQEMASLERLSRRGGKKFAVIGISTDDYPDAAKAFLQHYKTSFSHYIDSPPFPLENMLGANRLPLTLLVDAQGRVLGKYYGAQEWDSPATVALIGKSFRINL